MLGVRLDIALRMLCFDSQALKTLRALLGFLHLVSALPSGLRPEKKQNTSAELYARYVIGEYDTNRTGLVETRGPGQVLVCRTADPSSPHPPTPFRR